MQVCVPIDATGVQVVRKTTVGTTLYELIVEGLGSGGWSEGRRRLVGCELDLNATDRKIYIRHSVMLLDVLLPMYLQRRR